MLGVAAPQLQWSKKGRERERGETDYALCPFQQGEEGRPHMGCLTKPENHCSTIKQSNQMGCWDSLLSLDPEYISAFPHALGSICLYYLVLGS